MTVRAEPGPVVIVGAGQGGFQTALSLRDRNFDGEVVLVHGEPGLPYQRPPLSKAFLSGTGDPSSVDLRPESFYAERAISLRRARVESIDRAAGKVALSDGEQLGYGQLVLATGAHARPLPVPGADLPGVIALREVGHANDLRTALAPAGQRIAVIGAGFVGMEVAAVAAAAGHEVTVVEALPRPMARVSSPELADHVTAAHRGRGTRLRFGRSVVAVRDVDGARVVELDDGETVPADVVLAGIGAVPDTALAEAAGLAVDDGIVVDENLLTEDPRISAIGDCAAYPSVHAGGRTRLESVQNAVDHARHVAARLTGAPAEPYRAVPWFWTTQLDLRIQMVGLPHPDDERVVVGDPATGRFSVLRFHDNRLSSVESVNRAPDHMGGRKLLTAGVHPTHAQMQATGFTFDPRAYT